MSISIFISNETTTNILFLLAAIIIFVFAIRAINAHFRKVEGERRQEELNVADKRAKKAVKTLFPTVSDTAEDSAFRKDATELYRTALGDQTSSQDGHTLSKLFLEGLKTALSAILKKLG